MYNTRVTTTDDREFPILDRSVVPSWDVLTELLRREVSAEAAALFAEPVFDPAMGKTHWYTEADRVVPASALDAEQRSRLDRRFEDLRAAVLAHADRLAATKVEADRRIAEGLRAVFATGDLEAHLWSADGEPLLTAWGRGTALPDRDPAQIRSVKNVRPATDDSAVAADSNTARGTAKSPEISGIDAIETSTTRPIPRWWERRWASLATWLLFALVAIGIFLELLPACGIGLPFGNEAVRSCSRSDDGALDALRERNADLRGRRGEEERRVEDARRDCQEPPTAGPSAEQRLREAGVEQTPFDVTLVWDGHEDLDLHIACPGGHIYHATPIACGGKLDLDQNRSGLEQKDHPVEHVGWAEDPPSGPYRISVVLYGRNGRAERTVPFTVVVRDRAGEKRFAGTVTRPGEEVEVANITR